MRGRAQQAGADREPACAANRTLCQAGGSALECAGQRVPNGGWFVRLDDKNVSKGNVVIMLLSNNRLADTLKQLNQHKLREMDAKAVPQLKVCMLKGLEKAKDKRMWVYLQSWLLGAGNLAPKFRAGLCKEFEQYSGKRAEPCSP